MDPRHLGKLVRCPECGNMTHPLAEQIVGRRKPAASPEPAPEPVQAEPLRRCDNCGRALGRLETPKAWETSLVCAPCHGILAETSSATTTTHSYRPLIASDTTTSSKPLARRVPQSAPPESVETDEHARPLLGRGLSVGVPAGPLRVIMWLIALALAVWFVVNVVRFVSVLVNVAIVGLLLLAALYVLYKGKRNDATFDAGLERQPSRQDSADSR